MKKFTTLKQVADYYGERISQLAGRPVDFSINFRGDKMTFESFDRLPNAHYKGIPEGKKMRVSGYIVNSKGDGHDTIITDCELSTIPGNCGMAISTGAWVRYPFRGMGIGKLMHKMRIDMCKVMGYGLMQATVIHGDDSPQPHIMRSHSWRCVRTFKNPRTANTIGVYLKDLTQS